MSQLSAHTFAASVLPHRGGFYYTRELAKKHGILVGSSSGAAFAAALEEIEILPNGSKVVTIFPDSGDRYLSNKIYS